MAFRINDIRTNLKFGGARPTLFQVEIPSKQAPQLNRIVPFMVEATTIPSSTVGVIDVPYFGRRYRVVGDRNFADWSATVINDEDFAVRHALETWHNSINSLENNINTTGSSSPSNYKENILVKQYSKTNEIVPIRVYELVGAFPVDISTIDLSWAAFDEIERFTVTFTYDYFRVVDGNTGNVA